MDKIKVNNQVILMRKHVKQAKVHVINKLVKQIKLLQNRKGNEAQVQKAKRKADRYLEEVILLKKMKPDYVSKLALSKAKNWKDVLAQKSSTVEDRSLAILANYDAVQKEVEKFHSSNQNLVPQIPDLVKEWEEKSKLPKPPDFKRKKFDPRNFSDSVNFSHNKEILLRNKKIINSVKKDNVNLENNKKMDDCLPIGDESDELAKTKIISNKKKTGNKSRHAQTQNKYTSLKNCKKVENRLLENASNDENVENSVKDSEMSNESDDEVIEDKHGKMAQKKMIPNKRKMGNKPRSADTQNKHTSFKNTKKVENKLLEDASGDENMDNSYEDSEMSDELDDKAIEDKSGKMAQKKIMPNKKKVENKSQHAETQNKHTCFKNSKKIENKLLEDTSNDENMENSDSDSQMSDESDDKAIEDKHGKMAQKKIMPNKKKVRNKSQGAETQNKHTPFKNAKKIENKLLEDTSSDENMDNSDEDSEMSDESDDKAIEDKCSKIAQKKIMPNKKKIGNKSRSAETQNKCTAFKNPKRVENKLLEDTDENIEKSYDDSEVDESCDEALKDKYSEMAERKIILNKNKRRSAEIQNTLNKNSKTEEVSSDDNIENDDEDSEMIDEADSEIGENCSGTGDFQSSDDNDVDNISDDDLRSNNQNNHSRKTQSFDESKHIVKTNKKRKLPHSQKSGKIDDTKVSNQTLMKQHKVHQDISVKKNKIPVENNLKTIAMLNLDDLQGLDEIPINKGTEDEEYDDEEKEECSSKMSDPFFLRPDEFVSVSENKHFDRSRQKKGADVSKSENERKMNRFERRNGRPKREYMLKSENEHKMNRYERRHGRPKGAFLKSENNSLFQKRESSNFNQDRGFRKEGFLPKNQERFQNTGKKEFHSRDQRGFNKGGQNSFSDFKKGSFTEKSNKKNYIKEDNSSFREKKIADKKGNDSSDKPLHPSWEAKRKQKELTQVTFQGKRMVFDD